jgi:hypothetical protein
VRLYLKTQRVSAALPIPVFFTSQQPCNENICTFAACFFMNNHIKNTAKTFTKINNNEKGLLFDGYGSGVIHDQGTGASSNRQHP